MAKLLQNLPIVPEFSLDDSSNLDKRWKLYREEINLFLLASGISNDAQKRAVLLHMSGPQVREVFNTLEDTGTSYDQACQRLDEYFLPKKNLIYERWCFRSTKQMEAESCATYVTRLRKLIATCEYTQPEEEIRDQFVWSCYDTKIREKLLRTKDLSLTKILEICKIMEQVKIQAAEISGQREETIEPFAYF